MIKMQEMVKQVIELGGFFSAVVLGGLVFLGIFDKVRRQRNDEANKADDRLIALFKEQIEALERKVEEQGKKLERTKRELATIREENKALREILQGRDKGFQEYMSKGLEAMENTNNILKTTKENNKLIKKTNSDIVKLYKSSMEHHIETVNHHGS